VDLERDNSSTDSSGSSISGGNSRPHGIIAHNREQADWSHRGSQRDGTSGLMDEVAIPVNSNSHSSSRDSGLSSMAEPLVSPSEGAQVAKTNGDQVPVPPVVSVVLQRRESDSRRDGTDKKKKGKQVQSLAAGDGDAQLMLLSSSHASLESKRDSSGVVGRPTLELECAL